MSNYAGAFLIVAAVIVGYFLALPQWDLVAQLGAEGAYFDTLNLELDTLRDAYLTLGTTADRISEEDRNRIEEAIPRGAQQKKLMVDIEHFASVAKVNLVDIEFTKLTSAVAGATGIPTPGVPSIVPKNVGIIQELALQVVIEGSYENFKAFLAIIEHNLPIIDTEDIQFQSSKENIFKFNLGLKSYYQ